MGTVTPYDDVSIVGDVAVVEAKDNGGSSSDSGASLTYDVLLSKVVDWMSISLIKTLLGCDGPFDLMLMCIEWTSSMMLLWTLDWNCIALIPK